MKMRITVNADKKLVNYTDKLVRKGEYRNRSHAFDEALKLLKAKEESLLEKLRDGKL